MSVNQGSAVMANNGSSGNESRIGADDVVRSSKVSQDRLSATTFPTPFLSFIVMSNSWSRSIHLISLGFASFLDKRYLSAA